MIGQAQGQPYQGMPSPTSGPQQGWFQQMQQAAQAVQRQAVPQLQPMPQALPNLGTPNLFAGGTLGEWANGGSAQGGRQSSMPGIQGGRLANTNIIDIYRRWAGR